MSFLDNKIPGIFIRSKIALDLSTGNRLEISSFIVSPISIKEAPKFWAFITF